MASHLGGGEEWLELTDPYPAVKYKRTDRDLRPEQISALVLEKLKQAAERAFDASIEGAVITVPAYFTDSQRQATKTAGIVAGLKVSCYKYHDMGLVLCACRVWWVGGGGVINSFARMADSC